MRNILRPKTLRAAEQAFKRLHGTVYYGSSGLSYEVTEGPQELENGEGHYIHLAPNKHPASSAEHSSYEIILNSEIQRLAKNMKVGLGIITHPSEKRDLRIAFLKD
jgi:hypothetical protein